MKRGIKFLLLAVIIFNLGSIVWKNSDKYFKFDYWQRYSNLKFTYENSQYVKKTSSSWVPDEFVNAYAGGAVVKGLSPILVIADQPPLGKYLIGLSGLLFNNENIIILFCGSVSLFFLYLLGKQIYNNTLLALLPPALLSFEPLFINQFQFIPLLDIIQLSFLLPAFYFFNKAIKQSRHQQIFFFSLAGLFLGAFISTKFFITGLTVVGAYLLVLTRRKNLRLFLKFLPALFLAFLVLFFSYTKVFLDGEGLRRFFGIQKWILLYHQSQLILPFSIWPLILFNQWHVWWGNIPVLSDPQWQFTWPLTLLTSLFTIALYFLGKIRLKIEFEVLAAWVVFYILFFSFGQITARYLVIYLPILYLITIFGLQNLFKKYGKTRNL